MRKLGYSPGNPVYEKAAKDFAGLFVDDPEDFRIQPCMSPVWDTSINIIALAESGIPAEHPALKKAATWLVVGTSVEPFTVPDGAAMTVHLVRRAADFDVIVTENIPLKEVAQMVELGRRRAARPPRDRGAGARGRRAVGLRRGAQMPRAVLRHRRIAERCAGRLIQ